MSLRWIGLGKRHHLLFGEAPKGLAHQRMVAVDAVRRQTALTLAQCFADTAERGRRQGVTDEGRCAKRRRVQAESRWSRPKPVAQVADRLGAEEIRELALEGFFAARQRLQGNAGGAQLRPGEREVVGFHLHRVHVAASKMPPRSLEQRRRICQGGFGRTLSLHCCHITLCTVVAQMERSIFGAAPHKQDVCSFAPVGRSCLDWEDHDASQTSLCSADGFHCHALALRDGPIGAALRVSRSSTRRPGDCAWTKCPPRAARTPRHPLA